MLEILDLFSGSGSWIKNWYDNRSFKINITSVDIVKRPHITIVQDIKDFIPDKEYHIIYASIPCNNFSQLRQINKVPITEESLATSLELAEITFKLAKQAKFCYVIENPATGTLPSFFPDEKYQLVDYSEYGFPLRKRTALWSNIDLKVKTKSEISYNNTNLSYLSTDEKWSIPKKLTDRIKWIIIKHFKEELKPFRIVPPYKNPKFPFARADCLKFKKHPHLVTQIENQSQIKEES